MMIEHVPWLVALSIAVAIQGSYVGLSLAHQIDRAEGWRRRALLAAAALTLAVGIWSMHFVGMLAARLPAGIDYLVLPTLVSFLVCVLVVGLGLVIASMSWPFAPRLGLAATAMGSGIVGMHYIGMAALHTHAHMSHHPGFVALSILIAVGASGAALATVFGSRRRLPLAVSAVLQGLAISGMHYTAMAGTVLAPFTHTGSAAAPALSPDMMAMLVAVVAFLISGLFLLTLVPDGARAVSLEPATSVPPPLAPIPHVDAPVGGVASADPLVASVRPTPPPDTPSVRSSDPMTDRPTEPQTALPVELDGPPASSAAEPPFEAAPRSPPPAAATPMGGAGAPPPRLAQALPVQRGTITAFIPVDQIRAVQANAHYTTLLDGRDRHFCSLSISDVEARLDPRQFLRVHRSHLVRVDAIRSLRRAGDSGLIDLEAAGEALEVPVSRARYSALRTRLDGLSGARPTGGSETLSQS